MIAAFIVLGFLLFFGYFILFEWIWNGKTPGKRDRGHPRRAATAVFRIDFIASATRNLVRILEFGAGFYLLSAISTLLSPMNRRLGRLCSGYDRRSRQPLRAHRRSCPDTTPTIP